MLEHFVALVENKVLDVLGIQDLVADEGVQAAGGSDDDVGALGLVLDELGVLGHGSATKERADAHVGHVLRETRVLVLNLVGKLTRVAQNYHRDLAVDWLKLLQRSENEHSRLPVTRLGLAQDIHAQNGLRDTLLLD